MTLGQDSPEAETVRSVLGRASPVTVQKEEELDEEPKPTSSKGMFCTLTRQLIFKKLPVGS